MDNRWTLLTDEPDERTKESRCVPAPALAEMDHPYSGIHEIGLERTSAIEACDNHTMASRPQPLGQYGQLPFRATDSHASGEKQDRAAIGSTRRQRGRRYLYLHYAPSRSRRAMCRQRMTKSPLLAAT